MNVAVVAATRLEAQEARKALPRGARVVEAGIGLRLQRRFDGAAISCGIAGGLRGSLPTGTVLVPRTVLRPGGSVLACDEELVKLLLRAARKLGYAPVDDPLATCRELIRGERRAELASRGYAGVDMETGLIEAPRVACVRVILDTPQREIDAAWRDPASVWKHPRAWLDLPFLAANGPRCAKIAALVAAEAIATSS